MDKMICSQCGKEITLKPCPHCGSDTVKYDVNIADDVNVDDSLNSVMVSGASTSIGRGEGSGGERGQVCS